MGVIQKDKYILGVRYRDGKFYSAKELEVSMKEVKVPCCCVVKRMIQIYLCM